MTRKQRDTFFPTPGGDLGVFCSDGYTHVAADNRMRNNPQDAAGVYGSSHGGQVVGYGWRHHEGVGMGESCADVTTATKRKSDYGGIY